MLHKEINATLSNISTAVCATSNAISADYASLNLQNGQKKERLPYNLSTLHTLSLPQVLLATVRVIIETDNGLLYLRALLDQASQATLITEDAAQTLQLKRNTTFAHINGIGCNNGLTTRNFVKLSLRSPYDTNYGLKCNALILRSLTSYQPHPVDKNLLPNLELHQLADPHFGDGGRIDLILGADVYGEIDLPEHKRYNNSLFLQNTHFGWIISGPLSPPLYTINVNVCALEDQLRAFWEQEEIIDKRKPTQEEIACGKYFKTTHARDSMGRYTVSLPFKSKLFDQPHPQFTHTSKSALQRLRQLELKFVKNKIFAEEYRKFMREYEILGHMVYVGNFPNDLELNQYFLPHHGVLRESSSTTKLRVVFDGSSKNFSSPSLNEELSPGPALQRDLPTIITRWRRFQIGFRADLEKMIRQIRVYNDDQKYQQILWRHTMDENVSIYKLTTVTYGTSSAPYLSIRVLQQLAEDERHIYPEACKVLYSDTYVDDIISGADTLAEAKDLQSQLCNLLAAGCFNLRKWTSNSEELLNNIPEEFREQLSTFSVNNQNIVKALGIEWDTVSDTFSFKINFEFCNPITKRGVLSNTVKLYDPLGWLAPTTIQAKIMFQKLWLAGSDWNDPLPKHLNMEWVKYCNGLQYVEQIKIPRWMGSTKLSRRELHGFCDASQQAFAAVVYVRGVDNEGNGRISLLQSKTKVAPLKSVTIPRLELCAAVLLAKLVQKIRAQTNISFNEIFYWTDSTTVLSWIRSEPSRWSVYVGNRVAELQLFSNIQQWRYVPTHDNPADCASRGIPGNELKDHKIWWTSPSWLSKINEFRPKQPSLGNSNLEIRKSNVAVHTVVSKTPAYPDILTRFSSLSKLIRITAYMYRFYYKSSVQVDETRHKREHGFLKTYELQHALQKLVKLSQKIDFENELSALSKQRNVQVKSNILQLSPFIDTEGILRVGGRIRHSELNFSLKHPILLKKQNPLSILIFVDAHNKTLHGGLQQMQAYVLRKYWIISARNVAKLIQRQYVTCFRYNAKAFHQVMGDLPAVRLHPTRAFKHSGVDYAGPIVIKQSTARNSVTTKGYICLFICMLTKALHLEAVSNLSTNSFLASFRRFVARRGVCTDLYSDCGTNFIGASKELQASTLHVKQNLPEDLLHMLANHGTTWHFIPPASPYFGGLWEAGVKSTKHHLRRIMQNRVLTYEELSTLLTQIESCLNSRPLCPLSTDPSDFNILTPSHFLIGEPTVCVPEDNVLDCPIDRLSRWKVVARLKQDFWKRWSREYLSRLQSRPKWLKSQRNAEVGDLVIVFDERCPPGQWPLARIETTHPGQDGHVRVVTLRSKGKLFKRPVSKIAFLPTNDVFQLSEPIHGLNTSNFLVNNNNGVN